MESSGGMNETYQIDIYNIAVFVKFASIASAFYVFSALTNRTFIRRFALSFGCTFNSLICFKNLISCFCNWMVS